VTTPEVYDTIGAGYRELRRADPRLAGSIARALGDARTVVNVGAGAGSYEPDEIRVVAVEPSGTMVRQRPPGSAPAVRASAVALPFADLSFDASLAILTVHHWPDRARGLAELARVAARRAVVVTWDPAHAGFWLVDDYFPEIAEIDRGIFPSLDEIRVAWGEIAVEPLPVPHDCTDGFLGAYWRRPEAYLDARVRGAISTFARLPGVESGLSRLRRDLESSAWERRHGGLRARAELDLGYRIVIAERSRGEGARGAP